MLFLEGSPASFLAKTADQLIHQFIHLDSLNNGDVEGSFITLLEPVSAPHDPKSVVHNFVAPRIL